MINEYDTLQGDKYTTALCVNQGQLMTETKQEFNGIYRRWFLSPALFQVPRTFHPFFALCFLRGQKVTLKCLCIRKKNSDH